MSDSRVRLAPRLVVGSAVVAVLTAALSGIPLALVARHLLEEDLGERADAGAEMLAASLDPADVSLALTGDPEASNRVHERLNDLAEEADVAVASLVGPDGRLVASSDSAAVPGAPR